MFSMDGVNVGHDLSTSKIFAMALNINCHFFVLNVNYKETNTLKQVTE